MKKLLALALLVSMLAMCIGAQAEFDEDDFSEAFADDLFEAETDGDGGEGAEVGEMEDGFEFVFDDGGYIGEWTSVEDLGIEFFLPEGWTAGEAAEDEYFFAENEDGTAELGIVIYDDSYDGSDLADWADENLDGDDYVVGMANTMDVIVIRDGEIGRIMVLVPNASGNILGFNFFRTSENVLSDDFALEIAGTCTDLWV